jgi:hypothetical protein
MLYLRGSHGPEVFRIQERLRALGHYRGPIDGDFGGGTESAVRVFQRTTQLTVDGKVGSETWAALFAGATIPAPELTSQPVAYRCLGLTGSFETSSPIPECFAGLSGDFDGQGLSFGALQWNFGQGSLQPLLELMKQSHADVFARIFGVHYPELLAVLAADRAEQLVWARSIQNDRHLVLEPWRGLLKTLGRSPEFQEIETKFAGRLFQAARALCEEYGVVSERAIALMFDIKVQNGGIQDFVRAQILRDVDELVPSGTEEDEVQRLRIIANRRAEASRPRWVHDVRGRKLTIANGWGTVHGRDYDLAMQYGLRLTVFAVT